MKTSDTKLESFSIYISVFLISKTRKLLHEDYIKHAPNSIHSIPTQLIMLFPFFGQDLCFVWRRHQKISFK
jgi:hypothetical protein